MRIAIAPVIARKIARPDHGGITEREVIECFENHDGRLCWNSRPQHLDRKGHPSPWFVAQTYRRRWLKIMFVREGNTISSEIRLPGNQCRPADFRNQKHPSNLGETMMPPEYSDEQGPWESLDADLEAACVSAPPGEAEAVDRALGLQMVSIRLQPELVATLKQIAAHHKIGYQPMIRDLLNQFAASQIRQILQDTAERAEARSQHTVPVNQFMERERQLA